MIMEFTVRLTAAMATLASVKLRCVSSRSGTSGSAGVTACHARNATSTSTPAPITMGIVTGPTTVDHSWLCPSWMPNTTRNSPSPERTTPTRSREWLRTGSRGRCTAARQNAKIPTGTLTQKIQRHPARSTRTPPSSGPTSVATPAVAPQIPSAAPRVATGNMRVITVMVCGDIRAAPRPWTTRATTRAVTSWAKPHHRDAPVKTARPHRYTVRGPSRSPSRPVMSSGTA